MSTFATVSALQRFSDRELARLEAITQQQAARAPQGSTARRDALAALNTIRIVITMRRMRPRL